jgi:hypothetical protein
MEKKADEDIQKHYDQLDKFHLRQTEWRTAPIVNPEHDFVTDLVKKMVNDLHNRNARCMGVDASYCELIRKPFNLNYVTELINDVKV